MIRLTLPLPISANMMYRTNPKTGKPQKTRAAKSYEKEVQKVILIASRDRSIPVEGRVKLYEELELPLLMDVTFYFPDLRKRDCDNANKAVQDCVARAFGFDDSNIFDVFLHKRLDRENPRCEVVLFEAHNAAVLTASWEQIMEMTAWDQREGG